VGAAAHAPGAERPGLGAETKGRGRAPCRHRRGARSDRATGGI